jgi:hypothetical protein
VSNENKTKKVILYEKHFLIPSIVDAYESALHDLGFEVVRVKYGNYTQSAFKAQLEKSQFLIWFGATESQGIAQFQVWSMNVPTLILRDELFTVSNRNFPSSSSPYLDPACGEFFDLEIKPLLALQEFISRLGTFSPRLHVLGNYTSLHSFNKLQELFQKV